MTLTPFLVLVRGKTFRLLFLLTVSVSLFVEGTNALSASEPDPHLEKRARSIYFYNLDPDYLKINSVVFQIPKAYFRSMGNRREQNGSASHPVPEDTIDIIAILPELEHISLQNEDCFLKGCADIVNIRIEKGVVKSADDQLKGDLGNKDDVVTRDGNLLKHENAQGGYIVYSYVDDLGELHVTGCETPFWAGWCNTWRKYSDDITVYYRFGANNRQKWPEIDKKIQEKITSFIIKQ